MLLLRYNKITNELFENLYQFLPSFRWGELTDFGKRIDTLQYSTVADFLQEFKPIDATAVGDVFWPTGQNICKWGKDQQVKVYFFQHGQWIYIQNKRNPRHLPHTTFLFGDNVKRMVDNWPYGKKSNIYSTGTPRYDNIPLSAEGEYVYFAPPVMREMVPSAPSKSNATAVNTITQLKGIDEIVPLLIHPHYREGNLDYLKNLFPKATVASPLSSSLSLIQKSTKVLTHRNSTTVLDAIACGKKAILTDFLGEDRSFFKRGYFGEFAVENNWPKDCFKSIEAEYIVDYENYTERARDHIYLGNASQRIVNILRQDGIIANGP